MSFTREWDISVPSDNRKMNNFADDIRNTRVDIGERYLDAGTFFDLSPLLPTIPAGFSAIVNIDAGYTEDIIDRSAFQYKNDTPAVHTLSSKNCPMFFDSSGNVVFGYDTAGTAYYAKETGLTLPAGTNSKSVAHGIAGSISTNNKIYGVTIYTESGLKLGYDYAADSGSRTYEHCYVDDTDISMKRDDSATEDTFTVMIIYKA